MSSFQVDCPMNSFSHHLFVFVARHLLLFISMAEPLQRHSLSNTLSSEAFERKLNGADLSTVKLWTDPLAYDGGISSECDLHFKGEGDNSKILSYGSYGGGLRCIGNPPQLSKEDFIAQYKSQRKKVYSLYHLHNHLFHLCPWKPEYKGESDQFRASREWIPGLTYNHTYHAVKALPSDAVAAVNCLSR